MSVAGLAGRAPGQHHAGMVGVLLVSHSAAVADAVAILAGEIAGPGVRIASVGGASDAPGADPRLIRDAAVALAGTHGACVVLADLGSSLALARRTTDALPRSVAERVRVSVGPLVEGAVAAAVAAAAGLGLSEVTAEADGAHAMKGRSSAQGVPAPERDGDWIDGHIIVTNPIGLHARPAARMVQTAAAWDAEILVANASTGTGPASARSLTAIQALGAMQGHQLLVRARGPQAVDALGAIQELAARGFDDTTARAPEMRFVPAGPSDGRGLICGLPGAPGVAVAEARRLRRTAVRDTGGSGDPVVERARLDRAFEQARRELRVARDAVAAQAGEEHAAIMDAQVLLLDDEEIVGPAYAAVAAGTDAARAIGGAVEAAAQRLGSVEDGYLRARADDIRQLARLLGGHLQGTAGPPRIRGRGILIASDLSPAETAALDLTLVEGIVTAEGGPTSHTAIIARGLGVPAVVGAGDMALTIVEETLIMVDGDAGTVTLDPTEAAVARARGRRQPPHPSPTGPARTRDGAQVDVLANVASVAEVLDAVAHGADGVGLFRTEFLLMNRQEPPDEDEQEAAYRAAAHALDGRRLVLRTFDAGDDKPVPFLPGPAGMRGIRLTLGHPELLRTQLRAAMRVAADHPVAVMFPMVADAADVNAALEQVTLAAGELDAADVRRGTLEVGSMIEIPGAALLAGEIAPLVDFLSIGTNDLTRYTLALDRAGAVPPGVAPAVAQLVQAVCAAAGLHGVPVTVCGEAAGDPAAIGRLLEAGVRMLSVAAPRIPATRSAIGRIHLGTAPAGG